MLGPGCIGTIALERFNARHQVPQAGHDVRPNLLRKQLEHDKQQQRAAESAYAVEGGSPHVQCMPKSMCTRCCNECIGTQRLLCCPRMSTLTECEHTSGLPAGA
jgi:hypothetical protein